MDISFNPLQGSQAFFQTGLGPGKTELGPQNESSQTGNVGQVQNVTSEATPTEDGFELTRTITLEDGTTRTILEVLERDENMFTRTTTITDEDGRTQSIENQFSRTENGFELTRTFTAADGASREDTIVRDENGLTRTVRGTNEEGETRSLEVDFAHTEDGFELTRTLTAADGASREDTIVRDEDGLTRIITGINEDGETQSIELGFGQTDGGAGELIADILPAIEPDEEEAATVSTDDLEAGLEPGGEADLILSEGDPVDLLV